MKSVKKVLYFSVLLLFIGYLFTANYIFNVLVKSGDESSLVQLKLPEPTYNIKFAIDKHEKVKLKWKDALYINGWVFREGVTKKNRELFIVFKGNDKTLIFEVKNDSIIREGVTRHFNLDIDFHNHGFELYIPLYILKEDVYQIGFLVKDDAGEFYHNSDKAIVKSNELYFIEPFYPISEEANVSLNESNREISFWFDFVERKDKYISIQGWGFLKEIDPASQKSFVILKSENKVIVFNTVVFQKVGLANHFKETRFNLDLTGFRASIKTENLDKGIYKVGLYLANGDLSGIVYSPHEISID